MLFYFAAGLAMISRRLIPLLGVAFAACWWARNQTGWPAFRFLGNRIILEFLLGVAIASAWRVRKPLPLWLGLALLTVGGAIMILLCLPVKLTELMFTLDGSASALRVAVWGAPSGLLLMGALAIEPHLDEQWTAVPVFLGDASYAIYLTHWPVLAMVAWAVRATGLSIPYIVSAPVLILIALVVGAAFYHFIEEPTLQFIRARRRKDNHQSAATRDHLIDQRRSD